MRLLLAAIAVAVSANVAHAQSCPPPAPTPGANSSSVWFEFQVDQPARYTGDTLSRPFPDARLQKPANVLTGWVLAQFIVDTTGVPRVASLRVLARPADFDVAIIRSALERWRFSPGMARGCKVAQLVQIPVRWK